MTNLDSHGHQITPLNPTAGGNEGKLEIAFGRPDGVFYMMGEGWKIHLDGQTRKEWFGHGFHGLAAAELAYAQLVESCS